MSSELMDFFFDEQQAVFAWVFQYMPIGRSYTTELLVTPGQRRWMLSREMEEIKQKGRFIIEFRNGNVAPCVFFPYHVDNIIRIYDKGGTITSVLDSPCFRRIREWQNRYLGIDADNGNDRYGRKIGEVLDPVWSDMVTNSTGTPVKR